MTRAAPGPSDSRRGVQAPAAATTAAGATFETRASVQRSPAGRPPSRAGRQGASPCALPATCAKPSIGHYRCQRCAHEWREQAGPVTCPACGHDYVSWLNYDDLTHPGVPPSVGIRGALGQRALPCLDSLSSRSRRIGPRAGNFSGAAGFQPAASLPFALAVAPTRADHVGSV